MTWQHVEGGARRSGAHTIISVGVTTDHGSYGQTVAVATKRLEERPEVFGRTLDFLVRDVDLRVGPKK